MQKMLIYAKFGKNQLTKAKLYENMLIYTKLCKIMQRSAN